jgi:hypothetical protein
MTRDQVIECAKDWLTLLTQAEKWLSYEPNYFEGTIERQDVLNACVDLAFNRARDALEAYTKDRMAQFEAHERMLDTIEQTLQESIKDGL